MRVIGIIAIQDPDSVGDIIDVEGCDVTALQDHCPVKSDFEELSVKNLVGSVLEVKKVLGVTVVHPDNTEEAFLQAKVPGKNFIMVVANIDRDKVDPSLLPTYGFGIGGVVLERSGAFRENEFAGGEPVPVLDQEETPDGLLLKRTLVRELMVTTKPSHPAYRLYLSCGKCKTPDRRYKSCPCGCVTCECEAPDTIGAYDAIKARMGL